VESFMRERRVTCAENDIAGIIRAYPVDADTPYM
jgi:hypothetical protein